jgi:hypothetical protein
VDALEDKHHNTEDTLRNFLFFIFSPRILILSILIGTIFFIRYEKHLIPQKRNLLIQKEIKHLKKLRKPAFYGMDKKGFLVEGIQLPILVKNNRSISRLTMNIYVRFSNRYIKKFFTEDRNHMPLIYDALNTSIEQIIPHFPLRKEGKNIIKRKIKEALDELLFELKIIGEVEETYIDKVVGS